MSAKRIPNQRAIVDRRALTEAIAEQVKDKGAAAARPTIVETLRGALTSGREEIARRLAEKPSAGHECAEGDPRWRSGGWGRIAQCGLHDQDAAHQDIATRGHQAQERRPGVRD